MKSNMKISRREFISRSIQFSALSALGISTFSSSCSSDLAKWKIGCYTRPWAEFDYRIALDAMAEAGFKYCGLMTTKSESKYVLSAESTETEAVKVGEEIKNRGLTIISLYGGGFPMQKSLQAGITGLKNLIRNTALCGAESLLLSGTSNEAVYENYYRAVADCCDFATENRIKIALKPHGGFNADGSDLRKIYEKINHPSFTIWYDPGNIYYYSNGNIDPVVDSQTVDGIVTGMCVKDYQHPKKVSVNPGSGLVDFAIVMKNLKNGGFTGGPLIIETLAPGDEKELLEAARNARVFLENLIEKENL